MENLASENLLKAAKPPVTFPNLLDVELSDEYLIRKFSRPDRAPASVVYEVTKDVGYLHQYYRLREEMFINVWGLEHFIGGKDEFDDASDIIVARLGNHCIGGCRQTFSYQGEHTLLPMEKDGLRMQELLPELPLEDVTYLEISRMAILPEFQNSVVMLELIRQLIKRAAEKKAMYAFTLAPLPLARNYRKATTLFGLKWSVRHDVIIPEREEYEGIKMVLSVLDLASIYRQKPKKSREVAKEEALSMAD